MKNISLTINIYDYTDYRLFLQDAYNDLHNRDSNISYRYLQKKAGYSVKSNHFWQVLKGRVPLSQQAARRFGTAFGLNVQQTQFLGILASFAKAKSDSDKNQCLMQLRRYRGFRNRKSGNQINFEFYQDWRLPALRELVNLEGFKENGNWMANQMRGSISAKQAIKGIDKLLKLGFLLRTKDDKLKQSDPVIGNFEDRGEDAQAAVLAVRNFHRQMIKMGADCIEDVTSNQRLVLGTTMSISLNQAEAIRKLTVEYMNQVDSIILQDEQPEVVQRLNVQMFPLSKIKKLNGQ